jgi:hypothetical protein
MRPGAASSSAPSSAAYWAVGQGAGRDKFAGRRDMSRELATGLGPVNSSVRYSAGNTREREPATTALSRLGDHDSESSSPTIPSIAEQTRRSASTAVSSMQAAATCHAGLIDLAPLRIIGSPFSVKPSLAIRWPARAQPAGSFRCAGAHRLRLLQHVSEIA